MADYNKIVRDKIPSIIEAEGKEVKVHIARRMDACVYLIEKIKEEADELLAVLGKHSSLDELADLQEVIVALAEKQRWTMQEVEARRLVKKQERGGFSKNIILIKTSDC